MSDDAHPAPDPAVADERLRSARSSAGLARDAAAAALSVAGAALVAVEEGQRLAEPGKLLALARLYGVSVGRLTSPDAVHLDLAAALRRTGGAEPPEAVLGALALLDRLAAGAVQIERAVGLERRIDPLPIVRIDADRAAHQAEAAAANLWVRLGLGTGPASDLIGALERGLELRIFLRPLSAGMSGLHAREPAVGACMLIDADDPPEWRTWTAAQGAGFLLAGRPPVGVIPRGRPPVSAESRFAARFAVALLMPAESVRARFDAIAAADARLGQRAILLARQFGVPVGAMGRRLEELRLLPNSAWVSPEDRGLGGAAGHGGDQRPKPPLVPPSLARLASSALDRELLSAGQLCDLLVVDCLDLKDALAPFEIGEPLSLRA